MHAPIDVRFHTNELSKRATWTDCSGAPLALEMTGVVPVLLWGCTLDGSPNQIHIHDADRFGDRTDFESYARAVALSLDEACHARCSSCGQERLTPQCVNGLDYHLLPVSDESVTL